MVSPAKNDHKKCNNYRERIRSPAHGGGQQWCRSHLSKLPKDLGLS
jgi:hypothetical protein